MSSEIAYPVQLLREHLTALEAAITVCMASPESKPVHKLRTETRRVEALLLLLAQVPGLPEHRKEAATLLRSLSRLRRAAGEVRDLDVHRKMLEEFAVTEDALAAGHLPDSAPPAPVPEQAKKGKKSGKRPKPTAAPADTAAILSHAATELRQHMGHNRDEAAADLQTLLSHRQAKMALASEELIKVLAPAKKAALPAADLLRDAETVLQRDGFFTPGTAKKLKEDELHQVRKSAKAARYLAESLPGNEDLETAARDFETLQESGGQWHDALELARASRHHFGKSHALTTHYRAQRDTNLKSYRQALEARSNQPAISPSEEPRGLTPPPKPAKKAPGGRKPKI